ncbi:Homocysteine S-methyltransferase [Acephala macrosclerotiorum]|nr:Homocysteine S-methyltransferase [Acephala macrosclerotiorum]
MTSTKPKPPQPCEIILLDGGLGTTLTSPPHSIAFDDSTPLWSSHLLITSPETLLATQKSFADAGAEVTITATYQASFEGFKATGVKDEKETERLMRDAVRVGRESFGKDEIGGKRGKVALSLGAYGAVMIPSQEYSGNYDEAHSSIAQLREWHLNRLSVFLPSSERDEKKECWDHVDLVAFETLPRLDEILAAREVVFLAYQHLPPSLQKPFWISCVFPGESNLLPDGSSIPEIVKAMLGKRETSMRPMGIGINCTKVNKVEGLVREFEDAVRELGEDGDGEGVSLVIYPDGTMRGEVYDTVTKEWVINGEGNEGGSQKLWDEEVFEIVMRARESGVWKSIYVGGCCRTGPEEIGNLRRRIDGV